MTRMSIYLLMYFWFLFCVRNTSENYSIIILKHTISNTEFIDNIAFFAWCYTHFLSYVFHVDLQFFYASIVRISPDRADDRSIGQHFSGMGRKIGYDIVFRLCKINFLSSNKELPFIIVNQQILKLIFAAGCAPGFCSLSVTTENGTNTGQQFFCTERLCNIIICT